jgi:hypothetical protein
VTVGRALHASGRSEARPSPLTPLAGGGEIEGDVQMEQRGALVPGTVERLILWAKEERFRGSIDIRGDETATVSFSSGFIAHIESGDGDLPSGSETKERVHARLTQRLAVLLAYGDGSYVIHRTDELPAAARWLFGPQGLLDAARTLADAAPASRWVNAPIQLDDRSVQGPVELSADAFHVVTALARVLSGRELQADLGWSAARFDHALDELELGHLLHPSALPERRTEPTTSLPSRPVTLVDLTRAVDRVPAGPPVQAQAPEPARPLVDQPRPAPPIMAARAASAPTTPTARVDGGSADGGRTRASALRRLIQNLR